MRKERFSGCIAVVAKMQWAGKGSLNLWRARTPPGTEVVKEKGMWCQEPLCRLLPPVLTVILNLGELQVSTVKWSRPASSSSRVRDVLCGKAGAGRLAHERGPQ